MAYLTRAVAALALVVSATPAFASVVPEPGTLSLFGVGVVGAIVAHRFLRRGK